MNEQELLKILADRANNLDYDFVYNLFNQYRKNTIGSYNSKPMFKHLVLLIEDYNNSGDGFMCQVHKKVSQVCELCYMDALSTFELPKYINNS
ncbi:hypothetical protein GLOIN_2v1883854 [Rhizophagus clarus]|uniref:Uncharacterized protein n=1 Tax=Rhizophagus clarus TaxID=94130 RepID=A0A8H3QKR6_9GLOM|nr:hypothetical protein GLOIN_2v1883854 [Rhizophagus clarus]